MESTKATPRVSPSTCSQCGGDCEPKMITLTLRRSQYSFAVVRNVPADVCQNCGESMFSVPTAGRLVAVLQANRTPEEVALIPIYDLAVASP